MAKNKPTDISSKMELLRATEALELRARYAKADYDIIYYTLEAKKLLPDYQAYLKEVEEDRTKQLKAIQDQIEKANQEAAIAEETKG